MIVEEARALIKEGVPERRISTWADLGCGDGVFTYALAECLEPGSKVYGVDRKKNALDSLRRGVSIEFLQSDFEIDPIPLNNLDGILMANSLHFVKDHAIVLHKIRQSLTSAGRLIIVEYDTDQSNAWVPYPLSLKALSELLPADGAIQMRKVGERLSIYRAEKMYACVIEGAGVH